MKASPEELLFDDQVFLRQVAAGMRGTLTVRQTRPAALARLRNLMAVLVSDKSDRLDKSDRKAEVAANVMICLINHRENSIELRLTTKGGFKYNG